MRRGHPYGGVAGEHSGPGNRHYRDVMRRLAEAQQARVIEEKRASMERVVDEAHTLPPDSLMLATPAPCSCAPCQGGDAENCAVMCAEGD